MARSSEGGKRTTIAPNNDIRYIQELKKKHGIDYDVHASYRFVE